jgi:RHS repeat-associated protein
VTTVGFTGHRWQQNGGVWLTLHRAYDSPSGRWLSEDPIGLLGGNNSYQYAANVPVRYRDTIGLKITCATYTAFQYDVQETMGGPNYPGWTQGWFRSNYKSCYQDEGGCDDWRFDAVISLGVLVQFSGDPQGPSGYGNTLEEHEMDHVNSLTGSCHSIASKYQSEGFSNQGECEDALEKFLADLDREFLDAIDRARQFDERR